MKCKGLTWAISTSPKGSKYSLNSGSVVFHGSPSTIKSEHLFFSTLLFLATELSVWSSDFLLSAKKGKKYDQENQILIKIFPNAWI